MSEDSTSTLTYFSRDFLVRCGLGEMVDKGERIDRIKTADFNKGVKSVEDAEQAARFLKGYMDWARSIVAGTPWDIAEEKEHEINCVEWTRKTLTTQKIEAAFWEEVFDEEAYRTPLLPQDAIKRSGSIYEYDEDIGF